MRNKNGYHRRLEDFANEILVVCPKCSKQAQVSGLKNTGILAQKIKLVCSHCGYNKNYDESPFIPLTNSSNPVLGRVLIYGAAVDPYFHIPLWLNAVVDGNDLWAYNLDHLKFLEEFVSAKLRERDPDDMQNKSLGSRLPRWMTSSRNRDSVLKAIQGLKLKR